MSLERKTKVSWASIILVYASKQTELTFLKYNNEDDCISVDFRTNSTKTHKTDNRTGKSSNRLYQRPGVISKKEKDDLMTFCKKSYIPKHHYGFDENMKCNSANDQEYDVFKI